MLAVTENAVETIKAITSSEGMPEGAGLRISTQTENEETELAVAVTENPGETDHVLSGDGAKLFLGPEAADYLDDKVLDAQVSEEGEVSFAIGDQSEQQDDAEQPEQPTES